MQYLLMIYEDEKIWASLPKDTAGDMMAEYGAFTQDIARSGNYVTGEPLQPTSTATTVRVRDGQPLCTDGPFAETREQLGGFYLVEAADLDQAVAVAARVPSARWGSIEVRPVMVLPEA